MKAFSTKTMLLCGVFLTSFTSLSAQTGFLCDTVILKSGGLMFVKIVDTRSDIIAYRECTMDNNLTLYSLDLDKIREIRKAYVEQYVYNLKPDKSRPYFEFGLGGGAGAGINIMTYLSVGYQFTPKFGLGISRMSNFGFDESSTLIRSYTLDYRFSKGKRAFYTHLGFVSPHSLASAGDCNSKLVTSKFNPFLGFSWRHYNKRNFTTGINASLSYFQTSRAQITAHCPTLLSNESVFTFSGSIGVYFPNRYQKELVR